MKTQKDNKKLVDIGLDIGIASVGWAITDVKTLDIVEYGARLFPTVDDPKNSKLKNEKRREARSARRQVNRRRTLKRDFIKFLMKFKMIDKVDIKNKDLINDFVKKNINVFKAKDFKGDLPITFQLRIKALTSKLSQEELIHVLYWYINHRGFKYEVAGSTETKDNKELIKKYKKDDLLPIENQINYYKENGYLNGSFNRIFHSNDYVKELDVIFAHQKLGNEFKTEFISLFTRQRSFEDGPGNSKTPTKYGRHYELKEVNGEMTVVKRQEPLDNIWDATVGKCTFYPTEDRAPKKSITSLIFNLLNELNNISIAQTGEVLSEKQKHDIIAIAFKTNDAANAIRNYILKSFDLEKDDWVEIKGLIWDKKGKPKITKLDTYHLLNKILPDELKGPSVIFKDNEIIKNNIYDKLVNIYSKNKAIEKRFKALEKEFKNILSNEVIQGLSEVNFSGSETHSLSYLAMQNMIPDLITMPKMNQMKWANNNGIDFTASIDYGTTYLKSDWINDIIITPSVKRSFRQTTKVLNAIFDLCKKRNLEVRSVVVEMARETKNKDARDADTKRKKYLEEKRSDISGFIEKIAGDNFAVSNRTIEKIWLLEQQHGKDAYTGNEIDAEDVIRYPHKYDIDHIIPYSQSFSNNRSNKVLTSQQTNHKKTNKTPKQYLETSVFNKMVTLWESWYKHPKDGRFRDKDKFDHLTSELDFSKPENQLGFIQRNLVDTRYTTKAIVAALKAFSNNSKDHNFMVKTVNGKMTSFARNKISIKRDEKGKEIERLARPDGMTLYEVDEKMSSIKSKFDVKPIMKKSRVWNGHHAEDAYIVTVINSQYNDSKAIEKVLNSPERYDVLGKNKTDKKEVFINSNFKDLLGKFDIARTKLNNKMKDICFSRMVERKINTKLFNESLYKGKINGDKVIKYNYKYILNDDFKASDFFGDKPKNREKLLMFKHNKNLYNALNEIYLNYQENTLPFKKAKEEVGGNEKTLKVTYKNNKGKEVVSNVARINYIDQDNKSPLRIVKAKDNGNSFYDSMEWLAIEIYKNSKGRYKIILVDASNHIFKTDQNGQVKRIPKLDILNKQKESKDIDLDSYPYCTLYKGDLIKLPHDKGVVYVVGHAESSDKLEVKYLARNKMDGEKSRDQKTINSGLIGSQVIYLNVLGTKFKGKVIF